MPPKKKSEKTIKKVNKTIRLDEFMKNHRKNERDFSRKRKLPFVPLICFMLSLIKKTLQKELSDFFSLMSPGKNITKSAFCQSRLKLKASAFIELNDIFLDEYYKDNDFKTWKGFRLLGIDGSTLQLPSSKELLDKYGSINSGFLPMAKISSCFDLLNEIIVDGQISHFKDGEYELALKHMKKIEKKNLLIYDRGYAALWFMFLHSINKVDFLIRLHDFPFKKAKLFLKSSSNSEVIMIDELPEKSKKRLAKMGIKFKPFKVRLVKVKLENGQWELLATSLLDEEKYPTDDFKDLYFKRWGVEINFDHLKNNLHLEDFTGKSSLSVEQDFFANILISNFQALIIEEAMEENKEKIKNRELEYKINKNLSLGYLKDKLLELFMEKKANDALKEMKKLFLIEMIPIRKGRKNKREPISPSRKYAMNKKRSI